MDALFNQSTDSESDVDVVAVDAEVAGGAAVPKPKLKRKRDDEPVTEEGRSLRDSALLMRLKLDEVVKRSKLDRGCPWFCNQEEVAMWKQSVVQFDGRVKNMEASIKRALKYVGNEAGDLDNTRTLAYRKCNDKTASLKARRVRELEAIEQKYSTLLAEVEKTRDEIVLETLQAHKQNMVSSKLYISSEMERLERGCTYEYKRWQAARRCDVFLKAAQEGRVLDGGSELCVKCNASRCILPGCDRRVTYSFDAESKPNADKLRDVLSDRARAVNGAIALFCASGESCVISLSKLTPEDAFVAMPCKHVFDKNAISASMQTSNKCPSCRVPICNLLGYTGEKCKALKEISDDDE